MTDSPNTTPKPPKWPGLTLTLAACLLAVVVSTLAFCMIRPVRWDGLGKLGALALYFPLHLLVVTLMATVLAIVARRYAARFAKWVFVLVGVLTAIMALTPTIAVWQRARELDVPLSISTYLSYAGQINSGSPQLNRSVVYGTAKDGTKLELDVWSTGKPNTGPLRPAIVFVHGGAWVHGTRSMLLEWNRWLNELGYEVFDVEYRMPPRIVSTAQADALDQALTKAGVAHEVYLLPGNDHGFDMNWGGFGTQIARSKIQAFLQR